eukprot:GSA25T00019442001.1
MKSSSSQAQATANGTTTSTSTKVAFTDEQTAAGPSSSSPGRSTPGATNKRKSLKKVKGLVQAVSALNTNNAFASSTTTTGATGAEGGGAQASSTSMSAGGSTSTSRKSVVIAGGGIGLGGDAIITTSGAANITSTTSTVTTTKNKHKQENNATPLLFPLEDQEWQLFDRWLGIFVAARSRILPPHRVAQWQACRFQIASTRRLEEQKAVDGGKKQKVALAESCSPGDGTKKMIGVDDAEDGTSLAVDHAEAEEKETAGMMRNSNTGGHQRSLRTPPPGGRKTRTTTVIDDQNRGGLRTSTSAGSPAARDSSSPTAAPILVGKHTADRAGRTRKSRSTAAKSDKNRPRVSSEDTYYPGDDSDHDVTTPGSRRVDDDLRGGRVRTTTKDFRKTRSAHELRLSRRSRGPRGSSQGEGYENFVGMESLGM